MFPDPLIHHKRDRALGFPEDASALPDDVAAPDGFVWERLNSSGNSFAVPSSYDLSRTISSQGCLCVPRPGARPPPLNARS